MSKTVTPQEMFDLWQKMVNPSAYPLQSLMFPVLDPKELDRRISELEVVEHWLRANLNMLQLSRQSLEFQREMLKGGGPMASAPKDAAPDSANPAMWAWNMMAQAGRDAMESAAQRPPPTKKKKKKTG